MKGVVGIVSEILEAVKVSLVGRGTWAMDVELSRQMAESNQLERRELVKSLEEYRDAFSEDRISEASLPDACLPSFRDMKR